MFVNELDEPRVIVPYELRASLEAKVKRGNSASDFRQIPLPLDPRAEPIFGSSQPNRRGSQLSWADGSADMGDDSQGVPAAVPRSERSNVSTAGRKSSNHPKIYRAVHDPRRPLPLETPPRARDLVRPSESRCPCFPLALLTLSKKPDLQDLHASFIRPVSVHWTDQLYPVFSNSKLLGFNDILIPAWYYWDRHLNYIENEDLDFKAKTAKVRAFPCLWATTHSTLTLSLSSSGAVATRAAGPRASLGWDGSARASFRG